MKTHPNEILVMYDSASSESRKTLAYAYTLSKKVIERDFTRYPLTPTMWKRLLEKMKLQPKHLFNKAHPYYQAHLRDRAFDDEGWLNIIIKNTYLIKGPVVVMGNKAILCTNPTQIFSLLQTTVED